MNIRRLYDWVLHWSEKPYAPIALFLLSFAEASFFPIPPDVLLIALALGCRLNAFKYALICSIGSIFGALLGYEIGYLIWRDGNGYTEIAHFFFNYIPGFTMCMFENMQSLYEKYGFSIIFTAGFTPIPFKIFTISSGAFDISINKFLFATILSRSARFFLVSLLIWKYGKTINQFINRYFNILSIIFVIILLGSYFFIKLL